MKERQNIDHFFKNGIAGFKAEPSEKVWDNIEAAYFAKKGIAFKWYYLGAALLLLITAGGIWYFGNKGDQPDYNTEHKIIELPKTEIENKTSGSAVNPIEKEAVQLVKGESTVSVNKSIQVKKEKVRAESTVNDRVEATNSIYSKSASTSRANVSTENNARINEHLFMLNPLWIDIFNNPETGFIDPTRIEGMEKYLEKKRKSHFYTGATIRAGMMYYPSTTDQFTWTAGLDFGMTIKNIFFETGINYADTKERGIYSIELKGRDSIGYFNQVESFEIDPAHPEQIIYNTKEVTVYDSVDHYTHTTPFFRYQYFNVPISIGYKFFNRPKFTASVRTGIILSLMVNKNIPEADFMDPEYTVVRIQNNTPERVDNNLIWQIGVRFNYKINKSVSLSAEPVFTKYLNSIYNVEKNYPNVKPYTMGLQFGIYYGF
jgi:hypothetical protein